MFESLFEALFSYRPVVFQQGEFRFDVTAASLIATFIVAVVVGLAVLTYRRVRVNEGRLRDRIILTTLRVAALALVLFCLFRPTLIVRAAVDQQNVVAVLLDDSRSMDPTELEFGFNDAQPFEDLESGEQMPVVPEAFREEYRSLVKAHIDALAQSFSAVRVDYSMLNTTQPLDHALYRYLGGRAKMMKSR